ncbi:MAG: ferrochelatase [Coxiella sp. (in: Bacteria)]|nr:MAG: ferrochelatase [Coxiella sp. (in: g-proteobacteria)]
MAKIGVLLINLGTPDDTSLPSIRRYLDEFLMDPYVVDLPWPLRALLVKGFILRTRPKTTQHAYQQIWGDNDSPLRLHSLDMQRQLAARLTDNYHVELGMRYGTPSMAEALKKLMAQTIDKLIVVPLFPQYSQAATESAIQCFKKTFKTLKSAIPVDIIHDFYNHPAFIESQAKLIQAQLRDVPYDKLLMSYHGLPVKHLAKSGCTHVETDCKNQHPCPAISASNKNCYRAQCYATSRLLAEKLSLSTDQYDVTFQSRLGKTPWIKPYTDQHLIELRKRGIADIAITCPSFVADCLETLEEIDIRGRQQWQQLGGRAFTLVSCINSVDVSYLYALVHQ